MHRADGEDGLEHVPRILFELLVAEAEAAVVLVDVEDDDIDGFAHLSKFSRVLDLLRPAEVADVDQAVDAFFQFDEDAEVGEVAHGGGVLRADGVTIGDVGPRVGHQLLHAEAHLTLFAVEGQHLGFHLVAHLQEVLSGAQVLRPRHL